MTLNCLNNLSLGLSLSALRASQSSRKDLEGRQTEGQGRGGVGKEWAGGWSCAASPPNTHRHPSLSISLGSWGGRGRQTTHVRAH